VSVPENVNIEVSMEIDNWGFGKSQATPLGAN